MFLNLSPRDTPPPLIHIISHNLSPEWSHSELTLIIMTHDFLVKYQIVDTAESTLKPDKFSLVWTGVFCLRRGNNLRIKKVCVRNYFLFFPKDGGLYGGYIFCCLGGDLCRVRVHVRIYQ